MTPEKKDIIELIEEFQTISAEAKAIIILQIEEEKFEEDFMDILEQLFDNEIGFAESELEKIESEQKNLEARAEEEKKRIFPRLKKVKTEYMKLVQNLIANFENTLKEREKQSEQKIESIVHEKVEGSEIDALQDFLKQPKPQQEED